MTSEWHGQTGFSFGWLVSKEHRSFLKKGGGKHGGLYKACCLLRTPTGKMKWEKHTAGLRELAFRRTRLI